MFVADGVGIHESSLRQADEGTGGGIRKAQSEQQDDKAGAETGEQARQGKQDAAAEDEQTPFPDIPKDAEERLDDRREDPRDG